MLKFEFLKVVRMYEDARCLLLVALGVFLLAAAFAFAFKHTGIYAAAAFAMFGVCVLTAIYGNLSIRSGIVCLALVAMLGGGIYFLLFSVIALHRACLKRKRRKMERFRRLEYTLPEWSNAFIRTRLNTVLQVPEEVEEEAEPPIRLSHARRLLAGLKNAPLSMAERLQLDELDAALSAYSHKAEWSKEDVRAVNELCFAVVKLFAKYSV